MHGMQPFTILGAIDDSDQARLVLEHVGSEVARHEAAEIHLLRVIEVAPKYADRVSLDTERDAVLADVNDVLEPFLRAEARCRIHVHVRVGRPHEEIAALAHESRAHLIALGHHGQRRRPLAGNTVERVLRMAPCAVLVVQDPMYDDQPVDQCSDCVGVRAETRGERWFCEAHSAGDLPLHVMPSGSSSEHSFGFGSGGMF